MWNKILFDLLGWFPLVTCVVQLMLSVGQSVRLVSLNCDLDTIYLCTVTVVAKVGMTLFLY